MNDHSRPSLALDLTIPVGFLTFIGLGLFDGVLGVGWPSIRDAFSVNLEALGIVLLSLTAGFSLISFISGQILSRLPLIAALIAATGLRMLSMIAAALIASWWALIGAIFIFGAGAGMVDSALNVYFASHHRPSHVNWLHASFGVGATAGPLIMTALFTARLSWRWGMIAIAAYHVLLVIIFALTRQRWTLDEPVQITEAAERQARAADTLRLPAVWLSVLLFFLYAGLEVATGQWSFTLFTEGRSVNPMLAGRLVSLYWGAFTVGRFAVGFLADRVNLTLLLRLSFLASILGSALLWWNPFDALSFAGLALIGLSFSAIFPTLVATTPRRLGKAHAAHAIGFQIGAAGVGIGILPGFAGLLAARNGLEIIGPFLLAGAVAMLLVFEFLRTMRAPDASVRNQS